MWEHPLDHGAFYPLRSRGSLLAAQPLESCSICIVEPSCLGHSEWDAYRDLGTGEIAHELGVCAKQPSTWRRARFPACWGSHDVACPYMAQAIGLAGGWFGQ